MKRPNAIQLGFTLIELLVVIAIIGVLIAMGAATFSIAQRQARNATRLSDANAIQNCMEQCYADNNNSYVGCNAVATDKCGGWKDPKTGDPYNLLEPTADAYSLSMTMENVFTGVLNGSIINKSQLQ